ncbi:ubiquitin-conjugating enzyme E2 11-like [Impatiens glandulifera]|uniref:ubiquitin-conjugating enzyme E2 11-like n=1 Tax=Impatiens glandulifera TaxID=253017 RepID=UPI001FB0566D|nr:ubiquitin-conjugating enzyme E2 11-like [Impatiens glandulifera]
MINPTKTQLPVLSKDIRSYLSATRRLKQELGKNDTEDPPSPISYSLQNPEEEDDDHNLFFWKGIIYGAINTPFEGGIFHLSLKMPLEYPFEPPTVRFRTKVYHPYIDKNGVIDVDILGENWSPTLTIEKLMLSICSFLLQPDPEHDVNKIATLYRRNRRKYDQIAREWTLKYAMST